jgi:hypothetical protein
MASSCEFDDPSERSPNQAPKAYGLPAIQSGKVEVMVCHIWRARIPSQILWEISKVSSINYATALSALPPIADIRLDHFVGKAFANGRPDTHSNRYRRSPMPC